MVSNLKLPKPAHSMSNRLFHSFALIVGISIGVAAMLCLRSFSFTIPTLSFSIPYSISTASSFSPLISPPPETPPQLSPPPPPETPASPLPQLSPLLPPPPETSPQLSPPSLPSTPPQPSPPPTPEPASPLLPPTPQLSPPLYPPSPSPQPVMAEVVSNETILVLMHNMTDDELLLKASQTVLADQGPYKVAFMFLTPGPLPLAPFWDRFFKGHEGMYSIYVHPRPDYNESVPQDSAFYGRRIPSQPVYWGTISMIDAERRLLANALLDPTNQRFILLSDSCIPVMNFTTVYDYLMQTNLSFLQIFDDPRKPGRGRYNRQMWPNITIEQWRKGSQWFEIHRDLAVHVVSDTKYYKVFSEFCMPPCYNDEHYLATLVNILYPERSSNRTVTFVDWSRGGPHPRKYGWIDVKPELLNQIRFGFECEYNGNTTNMCHLFARKFLPNTLWPLLKIGPQLLGFDP